MFATMKPMQTFEMDCKREMVKYHVNIDNIELRLCCQEHDHVHTYKIQKLVSQLWTLWISLAQRVLAMLSNCVQSGKRY